MKAVPHNRDGRAAGLQEGRDLGQAKGFEIGYEVGLYEGEGIHALSSTAPTYGMRAWW